MVIWWQCCCRFELPEIRIRHPTLLFLWHMGRVPFRIGEAAIVTSKDYSCPRQRQLDDRDIGSPQCAQGLPLRCPQAFGFRMRCKLSAWNAPSHQSDRTDTEHGFNLQGLGAIYVTWEDRPIPSDYFSIPSKTKYILIQWWIYVCIWVHSSEYFNWIDPIPKVQFLVILF